MNDSFVYCWSDHKTAKVYVGVHKGSPDDGYVSSSKFMMPEYSNRPQDFTRQIVATGTLNDCAKLELMIIKKLLKDVGTCYNRSAGKLIINDADTYKRIGLAHRGKIVSQETKDKMSASKTGKIFSESRRIKMSEVRKGKKFSTEHRNKMSVAALGRRLSDETKKKLSDIAKQRWVKAKLVKANSNGR
jgi:hypothetical protein